MSLLRRFVRALALTALSTAPLQAQQKPGQTLLVGEYLSSGEWLVSGNYFLLMQNDGNLCVIRGTSPADPAQKWTWCTQTGGKPTGSYFAYMQDNGVLGVFSGTPTKNTGKLWGSSEKTWAKSKDFRLWFSPAGGLVLSATSPGGQAYWQSPMADVAPQRRLPTGGNASPTPSVYSSWDDASFAVSGAKDKWSRSKSQADDAQREYDTLRMSGGGSVDKRSQIDELQRKKDDAKRTADTFKGAFQRAVQGASNFVDAEVKAATTDAAKATAKQHQDKVRAWKFDAGL